MLIDTHAHLNFSAFDKDRHKVIDKCLKNNLWIINIGTKYETSKKAIEIAEKYNQGVYASVGLHPIHLQEQKIDALEAGTKSFKTKAEEFDYLKYKDLASNSKVIAIGEIGLDYWYKPKTKKRLLDFKELQKTVLCQQLDLALELNLPVVLHCRLALDDLTKILSRTVLDKLKGVVHCFTGNWKQAQEFLNMGFYIGFNGIIFKLDLDEVIKKVPLNKMLIETDCPYLTPPQENGRNEPLYVKHVIEKIAKIKDVEFKEIAEISVQNAKTLFNI